MALSEKTVDLIVAAYDGGKGQIIAELGRTHKADPNVIRYHLKKRGVYVSPDRSSIMDGPFEAASEETSAAGLDLTALMQSPEMQKAVANAVAERLMELGALQPAASVDTNGQSFSAFTETLKHLIEVQAMQQPGYQKPLSADEIDRRAAGRVEMLALLADCERTGDVPSWLVGESGFFECANAQEFEPGTPIRTYLPPVEDFVPQNDAAQKVHAAMMQWIGGPTPEIGEQVRMAHINSKLPPLVSGALQPARGAGLVEIIADAKPAPTRQRRSMGSIVPERREVSLAERADGPQGPVFVGVGA